MVSRSVSCVVVVLAVVSWPVLVCCSALDYSDLEAMGTRCWGRDSCKSMNDSTDFFDRNCECDTRCAGYGDCCIDGPSGGGGGALAFQDCMAFGTKPYQGAYVIASCPQRGGSAAAACAENDLSDPYLTAPVTVPGGGPTYRNAHCAACNGAELSGLVSWTPLLGCETLAPYNLSAAFVWAGLERAPRRDDEWGLWFESEFHACDVLFDVPESVRRHVRLCRADVTSACPDAYRRKEVRRQCYAYTAVVYTVAGAAYRNPHCALCNGVGADQMVCDYRELLFRRYKHFTLAHLFDVNRSDGDIVGQRNRCPRGQKYDPYSKKCRQLVCGIPGYKMAGGKCVKI